jgi:hypothetical protein
MNHEYITKDACIKKRYSAFLKVLFDPNPTPEIPFTERQIEILEELKKNNRPARYFCEKYKVHRAVINNELSRLTICFRVFESDSGIIGLLDSNSEPLHPE